MRRLPSGFTHLTVLVAGLVVAALPDFVVAADYDTIIRNGRVIDGSGNMWYRADIAIQGDTIAAIGRRLEGTTDQTIDVADRIVAPGFIDMHVHARGGIRELPAAENYIRMGVTTLVEGNDGSSSLPLAEFFTELEQIGPAPNYASFVGHGTVRGKIVGQENRLATADELAQMVDLVRNAMREGALGLSTGLFYVPGTYAPTEEVIELARVAGEMNGMYISHMRNEADHLFDSISETVRIGREANIPVQISHHKTTGPLNWGNSVHALEMIDEARASGVDVTVDQYPYTASSTSLRAIFPDWSEEGGRSALVARMKDPATRAQLKREIAESLVRDRGGADRAVVNWYSPEPEYSGKHLGQVAEALGLGDSIQAAAEAVLIMEERGGASMVYHAMHEDDVRRIMQHPAMMVGSDGGVLKFGQGKPHPRSYGTFARLLGHYVRDEGVLTLPQAVRKMTSLPAQRIGAADRGLLRPGMKADLVIFDPETVIDRATFDEPHQYADGFSHVMVNGKLVLADGEMTGTRPGRVLRGPAYQE